jgi:hypothetical protein
MDIFLSIIGQTKVLKCDTVLELHSFGDRSSIYLIKLLHSIPSLPLDRIVTYKLYYSPSPSAAMLLIARIKALFSMAQLHYVVTFFLVSAQRVALLIELKLFW